MTLPVNFTNDTPSHDQHPAAHNNTNTAVNTIQTDLDAAEVTIAANAAAIVVLPKGQINATAHAGGTIMQGTPLSIVTPTLTMNARRIRVTFNATMRAGGGAVQLETFVTAPGTTNLLIAREAISSGGAGSTAERRISVTGSFQATGNGTVTVAIANQTATNSLVVTAVAISVDDLGAV